MILCEKISSVFDTDTKIIITSCYLITFLNFISVVRFLFHYDEIIKLFVITYSFTFILLLNESICINDENQFISQMNQLLLSTMIIIIITAMTCSIKIIIISIIITFLTSSIRSLFMYMIEFESIKINVIFEHYTKIMRNVDVYLRKINAKN